MSRHRKHGGRRKSTTKFTRSKKRARRSASKSARTRTRKPVSRIKVKRAGKRVEQSTRAARKRQREKVATRILELEAKLRKQHEITRKQSEVIKDLARTHPRGFEFGRPSDEEEEEEEVSMPPGAVVIRDKRGEEIGFDMLDIQEEYPDEYIDFESLDWDEIIDDIGEQEDFDYEESPS